MAALRITDHAVLRFSERVYGVDLNPVRAEIAAIAAGPAALGATRVSTIYGQTVCIAQTGQGPIVTTVVPGETPHATVVKAGIYRRQNGSSPSRR